MTSQISSRQNVNKDGQAKVYFFWKSFEHCDQKYLEPYVHKCLDELEAKWGVTHSEDLTLQIKLLKTQQNEFALDPLVPFILGDKHKPQTRELLNFLETDLLLGNKSCEKENAFIDLCLVLGDQGRAEKCTERFGNKNYAILECLKDNEEGEVLQDIMTNTITRFHTSEKNAMSDSGLLTTFTYYIMEHLNDKALTSKISGLWWLGYYWDTICLSSILLPGNPIVETWKSTLDDMFASSPSKISWINAAKHVIKLKDGGLNPLEATVQIYDGIHPIVAYRLLKLRIAQLHETPREEDLSSMNQITFITDVLNRIVARLLISKDPCHAEDIASDAISFIKKTAPNSWTDYFPLALRLIYEPAIRMIAYIIAIMESLRANTLGSISFSRYNIKKDSEFLETGVMSTVVSYWLQVPMGKEIWQNGQVGNNPLVGLCKDLLAINRGFNVEEEIAPNKATACVTIDFVFRLAEGKMTKNNMRKVVESICKDWKVTDSHITRSYCDAYTKNFDPNPQTWKVMESLASGDTTKEDLSSDVQ